jgi:hypothetical protein
MDNTAQSAAELAAAFDALMQWVEKGVKPAPPSIAASCERLPQPCRTVPLSPGVRAEPYHTRFARAPAAH